MKTQATFILFILFCFTVSAQQFSILKDINPGEASSYPSSLILAENNLFFIAEDSAHGSELWSSDFTKSGTKLLLDLVPGKQGSNPADITYFNGAIYFAANDGINGYELWKVNPDGTSPVRLTNSPVPSAISILSGLIVYKNHVYFAYDDGVHGSELWKTNGTVSGTNIVKDQTANAFPTNPRSFFIYNHTLFFKGEGPADTQELYATDGTAAGTDSVFNCGENGCNWFTVFKKSIYFISDDQIFSNPNTELYVSNGTKAGTHLVKDINPNGTGAYGYLVSSGNNLFFSGDDGIHGIELWKSNGTAAGTKLVKDIQPGTQGSAVGDIIPYNNKVVFSAYPKNTLGSLWISDGTNNGTIMLDTIILDAGMNLRNTAQLNGLLFFNGYKHGSGYELCSTDGTPTGTNLVVDIYKGIGSSAPEEFTPKGDTLFFTADNIKKGYEIYKLAFATIPQKAETTSNSITLVKADVILKQNAPNPFNNIAFIDYKLPQQYKQASIAITDASGNMIKLFSLSGNGDGGLQLNASGYLPGIFYYSLLIDGKMIATRQMIISK